MTGLQCSVCRVVLLCLARQINCLGSYCISALSLKKVRFVFAYIFYICRPIFIIFADINYKKFATRERIINLSCTVCVAALPCKILITTLVMFTAVLVHSKCKIVILELVHPSKWNNSDVVLLGGHRSGPMCLIKSQVNIANILRIRPNF